MADPFTDLVIATVIDGVVAALEGVIIDKIRQAFGLPPNMTPATENHPLDIWTDVHDTFLHVTDPEDGLHAIAEGVRHFSNDSATIINRLATIDTGIANFPPPADLTGIPTAVWNWGLPNTQVSAYYALNTAYLAGADVGEDVIPLAADLRFGLHGTTSTGEGSRQPAGPIVPTPDWAGILDTDTQLSWLQRSDTSGLLWTQAEGLPTPQAQLFNFEGTAAGHIISLITEAEFNALKPGAVAPTGRPVAPVWPGLDKVTLGEPIALSNGLVINSPLDGLIFAITRDSAGGGRWQFGEVSSWNNVGAVMFETDGGAFERAITIGIDTQVVVPLTMVRAAGAVIRFTNPFSGTVTPWTITGA